MSSSPRLLIRVDSRFLPHKAGLTLLTALFVLLPLLAAGCNKGHTEEKPGSPEEKLKKMNSITEEVRQFKAERDKLEEKIKKLEHNFEQIRTSSLTAKVGKVKKRDLKRDMQQPGFIQSYETTPIFSYIPGLVHEISKKPGWFSDRQVDMGDFVKKDDMLVVLYVPERDEDVIRKNAYVKQAEAELKQAETLLKVAVANVQLTSEMIQEEMAVRPRIEAKYQRWKSELARIEKLYREKVVDKQVLDETLHQADGALGELGEVEAKIKRAQAANNESKAKHERALQDIEVSKSRIVVAKSDERESERWRDYKNIKAPYNGMITQRNVHTGWLVKPGQGGEKGEPLFTMIRMDRMRITVDVPEADAVYIKVGDPARIHIDAQQYQNKPDIEAPVTRISEALDGSTRTLRVEVEVDNEKYNLRPGMYAYANIDIDYKDVWAIPEGALLQKEEEGAFVLRDVDGKVVLTKVRIGIRSDKQVQLLKYQEKPASSAGRAVWRDFTGNERIIMNPTGFVDGIKLEQIELES